ncbi:MAG: Bifunctional PGK/TIM [Chlamydiia bacterium]|nr:Bifunctional PGK/TIM [Chlamydiia bacterium]MCH9616486.1 Bifunctional PGK/TIM [Chlamydiia bacterium]MCH9629528.1 Bifunctional PGK/TIM [Chlamydiia bacterium]
MKKLSLYDIDLKDKRVIMRVDFNVPLEGKKITDDMRILKALPSIQYILSQGAKLILMSHLGRPKGETVPNLSLDCVAKHLGKLLDQEVVFAKDCIGPGVEALCAKLKGGEVIMLENLRFHPEEETGDTSFAKALAGLADIYVNDAFGTAHRSHASTKVIAEFFPGKSIGGFLLEKETSALGALTTHVKHPFHTILGGAKVASKLGILKALIPKIDALYLGGGMIFTFFKAHGIDIGSSIVDMTHVETAKEIEKECTEKAVKLYLPKDVVITDGTEVKTVDIKNGIPTGWSGMDIGPLTNEEWQEQFKNAATIFWNGPVGVFEDPKFANGTNQIAESLAKLDATTIVGGGDSVAAIRKLHLEDHFSHASTGGGASLEFIEYGHLPGIDALSFR